MADKLSAANAAFVDEDFESALSLYTEAIEAQPCADAFLNRAHAHLKLEHFVDAVADATKACEMDPTSSKASLRLGIAYFELEEFQSAKKAFETGGALDADNKAFATWIRKCDAELEMESDEDDEAEAAPKPPAPAPAPKPAAPAPAKPETAASKIRHEWYQNSTHVIVTVFSKNVAQEAITLDLQESALDFSIKLDEASEYQLAMDLFDSIDKAASSMNVMKTKIEIKLKKAREVKWEGLERQAGVAVLTEMAAGEASSRPSAYSSKKNWDSIDKAAEKEADEDKPEGEAALNKLFQDIYKNADEDTRRAMMKSFQTSGGTVLSTNWGEVSEKDYEAEGIKGPDGMEWKKWSDKDKS